MPPTILHEASIYRPLRVVASLDSVETSDALLGLSGTVLAQGLGTSLNPGESTHLGSLQPRPLLEGVGPQVFPVVFDWSRAVFV